MVSCSSGRRSRSARVPGLEALALGAVVNFFDTLGIGSFATTTAWFKFRRMVPDRLIPQTLLCGLTPPAMTESIIFLILLGVMVDPAAAVQLRDRRLCRRAGGVPLVTRARVWVVQIDRRDRPHARRRRLCDEEPRSLPRRRDGRQPAAGADDRRDRRQFRLRHSRQFRGRQLCAHFGDVQPDGHGPQVSASRSWRAAPR